jgi:hypothetical protein
VRGTPGNDRLQTVNGVRDVVSCGRGRDLATVDARDRVARDCEVVTREISQDPYRGVGAHGTQVEPDTASWGSTVVAAFQVGRVFDGGATNIGFAVSRDRGHTWTHGFLPRLTRASRPAGSWPRASDPTIAYDTAHRVWLVASLTFGGLTSGLVISRSTDGLHWQAPVTATVRSGFKLDKQWLTCDNWGSSPFRGRCYLSYDDLESDEIETQVSADGGLTWSVPAAAPGNPGRASIEGPYAPGVQPVVRPDGSVVVPYFDNTHLSVIRSLDGGTTWLPATPIAPAAYRGHVGLRAAPLPSAEVDTHGTVYVAWADCSRHSGCSSNDLLVVRSADGVVWSPPVTVPTGARDVEVPGLAADARVGGRVAIAYYVLRAKRLDVAFVSSRDGGTTWTKPQRLNSRSIPFSWTASTAGGAMVGDYMSTSFAGGRAVPVFALGFRPRRGRLHESMFATSLAVPH